MNHIYITIPALTRFLFMDLSSERREGGHLSLPRLQLAVDRQDVEDLAQLHVLLLRHGAGAALLGHIQVKILVIYSIPCLII